MLSPRRRQALQTSIHLEVDGEAAREGGIELLPIDSQRLPTYDGSESEFEIVLRRQRSRLASPGPKSLSAPSRLSSSQADNVWEFSGWGSTSNLVLTERDLKQAQERVQAERASHVELGHLAAASIPAMGVLGSVFYSLPAVVAVCGLLSPISLLVATLLLFLIRPVMEELASALPIHGSAYAYLLNTTTKSFALVGASFQLIDYVMNALQASASTAAYIAGEASLSFPQYLLAGMLLVGFAVVGCLGAKESASITLIIACFHLLTMAILMLLSIIAWGRRGNGIISANWHSDLAGVSSDTIARRLFDGVCLGLLAISGFECSPEYAPVCGHNGYRKVLRNLHWCAIILIGPIMLFMLALLPIEEVLSGYNILSLLAESIAGRWFRYWIFVDAIIILGGGILTGGLSACSLVYRLAQDGMLPAFLLRKLPITHAPWAIQAVFTVLCIVIYASTGASVQKIGQTFSISLLSVLALFPISDILLKYNRGRLPRQHQPPLGLVLACLAMLIVVFAGNVALDPATLFYSLYSLGLAALLLLSKNLLAVLRSAYWAYDCSDLWRRSRWTRDIGPRLISWMRRLRRQPVICFVKTDDVHSLIRFVLYVQRNEWTAHLKFVHLFEDTDKVPPDFEAFSQILDEAFPAITIDMVFVHGYFDQATIEAICHKLLVPRSSVLIASFGKAHLPSLLKESGLRIVSL